MNIQNEINRIYGGIAWKMFSRKASNAKDKITIPTLAVYTHVKIIIFCNLIVFHIVGRSNLLEFPMI